MLDRAAQLAILVTSNRQSLRDIHYVLEEMETGQGTRGSYSQLKRSFHTIKHEAKHLGLERLAELAAHCESIVEQAAERRLGLPIDLLGKAELEILTATETIAAGGTHRLDAKLIRRLGQASKHAEVD